MRRTTVVVCERSAVAGASAVCQCYDLVLPLAVGEWEEWRFAATSDVLKLRLVYAVVKLRRRAAVAYGALLQAAARIDRLVHHCHLVTIRGNSYGMLQHTELWQTPRRPRPRREPLAMRHARRQRRAEARPSSICQIFNRRNCRIYCRR